MHTHAYTHTHTHTHTLTHTKCYNGRLAIEAIVNYLSGKSELVLVGEVGEDLRLFLIPVTVGDLLSSRRVI